MRMCAKYIYTCMSFFFSLFLFALSLVPHPCHVQKVFPWVDVEQSELGKWSNDFIGSFYLKRYILTYGYIISFFLNFFSFFFFFSSFAHANKTLLSLFFLFFCFVAHTRLLMASWWVGSRLALMEKVQREKFKGATWIYIYDAWKRVCRIADGASDATQYTALRWNQFSSRPK